MLRGNIEDRRSAAEKSAHVIKRLEGHPAGGEGDQVWGMAMNHCVHIGSGPVDLTVYEALDRGTAGYDAHRLALPIQLDE
jgi:hypothetical protein